MINKSCLVQICYKQKNNRGDMNPLIVLNLIFFYKTYF